MDIKLDREQLKAISAESHGCSGDSRTRGGMYVIKVYYDLDTGDLFYKGYTDPANQWTDFHGRDVIQACTISEPASVQTLERKALEGIKQELDCRAEAAQWTL